MNFELLFDLTKLSVEELAILLLLVRDRVTEKELRKKIEDSGLFRCAVTEMGTNVSNMRNKIISAVIGASVDCGVINKIPPQINAILQATEQALRSILDTNLLFGNMGLKLSIVRDSQWIAVGIFGGFAAYHAVNHKRIAVGVMHISY